jgi:hypothetical protein
MRNMVGKVSESVSTMAKAMLNNEPGTTAIAGHRFTLLPRTEAYNTDHMMMVADLMMEQVDLDTINMDSDVLHVWATL